VAHEGLEPRRLAFDILLRVETSNAFADSLLGRGLARARLAAEDRALATRLVYGNLAWRRRLDWIMDHWAKPPSARLEPEVRVALRLGLFQLFFSDRIPAFAAVDTSVELVKEKRRAAAPLVNAVLRRAAREGAPTPPSGTSTEEIALRWSHPDWLVRRWIEELGAERAEALLRANNEPAPLTLRASASADGRDSLMRELEASGTRAVPGRYSPLAVDIAGGFPAAGLGHAIAQGEASQLVPFLLSPDDGTRWLDACAAPGGKASELVDLGGERVHVFAVDLHRAGLRRIRDLTARAMRAPGVAVADSTRPPFAAAAFDAALVDAPCSGTGTLRSHPEIRWRLREEDVGELASRQLAILEGVAAVVRPGGALVYATCSLLRRENEEVIRSFLSSHPEWTSVEPTRTLPASARELVVDGALRTAPDLHGLDGFFAVRLERS
jgi:16S rRNA (cytosine967-C5)-methyltransferase